jgi:hypothetical protein
MDCTDAYREALIRDFSARASSAPASTSAPGRRRAAEDGREDAAGPPAQRRSETGPDDLGDLASLGAGER